MTTETEVRDADISVNGQRLHYRDWSDPAISEAVPPVVLLHAYLQHARTWDTVARTLAARLGGRVLALDQRGFGESAWVTDYHEQRYVGDLAAFLDVLKIDRCALVGISIGGGAAISYAATHPERATRLVALECFTSGEETGDAPYLQEMRAHIATLRSLPEVVDTPEDAAAAFRPLAPYAAEEELVHWVASGLVRRPDGRWTWRYDPAFRVPGPPGRLVPPMDELHTRLERVRCPLLLPVGAESWMVEPTYTMAAVNPRARVVVVPRAGHWIPLDNPAGFTEVVGEFLAAR